LDCGREIAPISATGKVQEQQKREIEQRKVPIRKVV
jgi:hypothetical protein